MPKNALFLEKSSKIAAAFKSRRPPARASAENFLGEGQRKKKPKISKKIPKIALFASSRAGPTEKRPKK